MTQDLVKPLSMLNNLLKMDGIRLGLIIGSIWVSYDRVGNRLVHVEEELKSRAVWMKEKEAQDVAQDAQLKLMNQAQTYQATAVLDLTKELKTLNENFNRMLGRMERNGFGK